MAKSKRLLVSGLTLNQQLSRAAYYGHLHRCKVLLNSGADVNAKDYRGESVLSEAAGKGHVEVCRLLISRGAKLKDNITGEPHAREWPVERNGVMEWTWIEDPTPLHWAAMKGSLALCQELVEAGADQADRGPEGYGPTPLEVANGQAYDYLRALDEQRRFDANTAPVIAIGASRRQGRL